MSRFSRNPIEVLGGTVFCLVVFGIWLAAMEFLHTQGISEDVTAPVTAFMGFYLAFFWFRIRRIKGKWPFEEPGPDPIHGGDGA